MLLLLEIDEREIFRIVEVKIGKMPKNDGQTLGSIKFSLEVGKRQNKFEIIKSVTKVPMGLSISSKQFRELFLQKSSDKA